MSSAALRHQLKKKRPFDSVELEAMLSILRTSDLLENRLTRLLWEFNLTPSRYNLFRILRGKGQAMPCPEVADRMIQVGPAITRVVDRLATRGLIDKWQSRLDRRVFLVAITRRGAQRLKKLDSPIETLQQSLLGHVPRAE